MNNPTKPEEPQNVLDGFSLLEFLADAGLIIVAVLALLVAVDWAFSAKPPEKIEEINCSIFDGYPIMLEARPFLDDVQAPEQLDFKTRVAYVADWSQRRASATARYDRLLEACRVEFEKQKSGD